MPQGAAGVGRKSCIVGDLVGDPDPELMLDRFISAGYGFIDNLYVESLETAHSGLSAKPTSKLQASVQLARRPAIKRGEAVGEEPASLEIVGPAVEVLEVLRNGGLEDRLLEYIGFV
ncbi:MAG: hypothetical protein Q9206_006635 [Seirophora lacunosa]